MTSCADLRTNFVPKSEMALLLFFIIARLRTACGQSELDADADSMVHIFAILRPGAQSARGWKK